MKIFLLGQQAITDDANGEVRPSSSKTLALLTLLVLYAGRPQTRQRVAAALWPNSTDAQALTNLRRELHHLRQIVGDTGSLEITARHLCWRDSETCRVDVRLFEQPVAPPWPPPTPIKLAGWLSPRPRWRRTAPTCCPGSTTTGYSS